jgi:hypothetical protein
MLQDEIHPPRGYTTMDLEAQRDEEHRREGRHRLLTGLLIGGVLTVALLLLLATGVLGR